MTSRPGKSPFATARSAPTAPNLHDTGGWLRALARTPLGGATFPEYEAALTSAGRIIVPGMVLDEVDYFLRADRKTMRKLVAEVFDHVSQLLS